MDRLDWDATIEMLAATYPKCFFMDHKQRLPLKKNIDEDLLRNGMKIDPFLLEKAMDRYKISFGYNYAIVNGKRRINLDGKEVESVTMEERRAADKHIKEAKEIKYGKPEPPSDDNAVKRLVAPPMKKTTIVPELARVYDLLMSANGMFSLPDGAMRVAVLPAALGLVANELQKVAGTLKDRGDGTTTTADRG
jgi:hypothetical protein